MGVRPLRKGVQWSRRKLKECGVLEPLRISWREGVIKCHYPSASGPSYFCHLDHRCSRQLMTLGIPPSPFQSPCFALFHFFLSQNQLLYNHLQKPIFLTPRVLMVHLILLLGKFRTNLCGEEKGYYQGRNIPLKPLLFFHLLLLPQCQHS